MQSDMEYIRDVTDRYVYEATRRLPAAQRQDIEQELRTLIDDMLAGRTAHPGRQDIDAVLLELGSPWELSLKYLDRKHYLIGPGYYGLYLMVLKIVMAAVAVGITVALAVGMIHAEQGGALKTLIEYAGTLFVAELQCFAWVTVGFALTERYVKNDGKDESAGKWKPQDLPPVPVKKAVIPKSEPIAGIVFGVIAIILFNTAPQLFSVYAFDGTMTVIPIFDAEGFRLALPLFNVIFVIGILAEMLKLIIGRHCFRLAVPHIVLGAVSLVLSIVLLTNPGLWNQNFIESLKAVEQFHIPADLSSSLFPELVIKVLLGLAVFGFAVDSITFLTRAFRYKC